MTEQILTLPSSLSSWASSKDTLGRVTADRPGPVPPLPSPVVAAALPPGGPAKSPSPRGIPVWPLGLVGVLASAAAYVYVPTLYFEETDDAYVQADTVSVVPKVAGYVTALHVTDNTHFKANELLVEIDPRDFKDALRSAEANLQGAEASKANVLEQLSEQSHVVTAAQATIGSDRATLEFAQQELARYTRLANDGYGTQERQQQAVSDIGQRKANLQRDLAGLAAAQAQVGVLQTQAQQADAIIAGAQAAVAQAQLNLSYRRSTQSWTEVSRTGPCRPATMCSPAKRCSQPSQPKSTSSQTSRRPSLRTCAWVSPCAFESTRCRIRALRGISIAFSAGQVRTLRCFLRKTRPGTS
jgi:Biotin-lipoyl like